jgi:hypothetical protein
MATEEKRIEILREYLTDQCRRDSRDLDAFEARFHEDPAGALEMSRDAFHCAARYKVGSRVLESIAKGSTIEEIQVFVLAKAVDGARWARESTSPVSNFYSQAETAAYADLISWLVPPKG